MTTTPPKIRRVVVIFFIEICSSCLLFPRFFECRTSKSVARALLFSETINKFELLTNFIEFVPNSVSGSASELLNQLNIKKSHIIVKNYLQNGELKDKVEIKYGEVIKS